MKEYDAMIPRWRATSNTDADETRRRRPYRLLLPTPRRCCIINQRDSEWVSSGIVVVVFIQFIWDLDDDPDGNVQHLLEHDVTKEEAEHVLRHPDSETTSDSSGRPLTFGYTADGRHLAVVWEHVFDDPLTIYPVTAFDAKEPI